MKTAISFMFVFVLALSLTSFAEEKKVEMKVEGMTCNGCVNKVKTSLEKVDGVKNAEVSLKENSAVVLYDDSKTTETTLKDTVNETGFKVVDAKEAKAKKAACCEGNAGCCAEKK